MTVTVNTKKVSAPTNGSATTFSFFPMILYTSTDLQVVEVDDTTGVETPLSEGTGASAYAVVVADYPGTGEIRYPEDEVTPRPSGKTIVMKRVLPFAQSENLENQGGYLPENLERALDKSIYIDLQQQDDIDRSIKLPVSAATTIDTELPPVQPLEFLRWNAAGDGIETSTATSAVASNLTPVDIDGAGTGATAGVNGDFSRADHVHELPATISQVLTFSGNCIFSGANTFSGANNFTNSNTFVGNSALVCRDDDSGAGFGPYFQLWRNSSSPANNDLLGNISFLGEDDASNTEFYALFGAQIIDVANGSEDARLFFQTMNAGTLATRFNIGQGAWTDGATGGDQGVDTINAKGYAVNGVQGGMLQSEQVFTASGTWTRPTGCKRVKVYVTGGGGGGGGAAANRGAGGGGGGGTAVKLLDVSSISSATITIGAAGGGGAAGNNNGSTGGNSSWADGTNTLTGNGGAGGSGGGDSARPGGIGGIATNGTLNMRGSPGHDGFGDGLSVSENRIGAAGGSSFFGGGAIGVTQPSNGATAGNYGAGGGGAAAGASPAQSGGNGSAGVVYVEEYY